MTPTRKPSYAARATNYARNVVDGKILACKWVKLACQRHLDDLARPDFRWSFDAQHAHRVCAFAERMPHEKGILQGQPFRLEDWQIFLLASIFGWIDADSTRKYREAFILVPRGNGKSPLAAIIALWMGFLDGQPGAEVVCGATTEAQAHEVFRPAKAMVEQRAAVFAKIGVEAAAKSIYQTSTRSKFKPVIGKAKYGGSPYCAILDEAHQLPDDQLYVSFKTGCNKRKNSLLLTISTAGVTSTQNHCYQQQQDVQKVLEGIFENERLFGIVYTIDETVEWTSRDAVIMANPNLGVSNDAEALFDDHEQAIRNAAKQNGFRSMHLNQWTGASSAWMRLDTWAKCADPTLTEESLKGLPCWIGADLASKIDLAATVRLYRKDVDGHPDKPHYYAFTRAYLPEERVNDPQSPHYKTWAIQGRLTATSGNSIDYSVIEADTVADIGRCDVSELCYDPSHADQWAQRINQTTSVTLAEIPQRIEQISPAMKELEAAVWDGRFHFDANPLLTWCVTNVLTRELPSGDYIMPRKERPENKIDAAMALFIAMRRASVAKPKKKRASFTPFFV
jgi:phage terminase large subunit-like protein